MRPGKFSAPPSALCLAKTSELRNRMSLGAQRDRLLQLMLFDGLRLCPGLFSLGRGLLLSFVASQCFPEPAFSIPWFCPA
jgi:hypothetical protein